MGMVRQPAEKMAKSAWTHSARVVERTATAWLFFLPRARRPRATSRTISPTSLQESVFQAPPCLNCWAGLGPLRSTRAQNMRARVSSAMLASLRRAYGNPAGLDITLPPRRAARRSALPRGPGDLPRTLPRRLGHARVAPSRQPARPHRLPGPSLPHRPERRVYRSANGGKTTFCRSEGAGAGALQEDPGQLVAREMRPS